MRSLVEAFASLRLTAAALVTLAGLAVAGRVWTSLPHAWMALPAGVVAINLAAALAVHPRLRARRALAVFHWALIGVCALIAVSVLGRFEGEVEVVTGTAFDPADMRVAEDGPWAGSGVDDISFVQGDLSVDYLPGLRRQQVRTSVVVDGQVRQIDDLSPLEAAGYRMSATANKGFAVMLAWRGADGDVIRGAVHLPSYPVNDWRQSNPWRTPAGEEVIISFHPTLRVPMDQAWTFSKARAHGSIFLRTSSGERLLEPGVAVDLRGGTVTAEGVRLWVGYSIERDPAMPWLFVVAAIGLAALGWHFLAPPAPVRRRASPRPETSAASHVLDRG